MLGHLLPLLLTLAAEPANLAPLADIVATPELQGETAGLVDGRSSGSAFAVGTEGPGAVIFTWPTPRLIERVRISQSGDVYRMDSVAVEVPEGEGWRTVAEAATPAGGRAELRFEPLTTATLRVRALTGESKGRRAYPVFGEIQILGEPAANDHARLRELGRPVSTLSTLQVPDQTRLMTGDRPPTILAGEAYRAAAERLRDALGQRLGVSPPIVAAVADAPLGETTVIALGNMLDNELLTRLYFNGYTYENRLHPGGDGFTLHTVHDPYPWGGGHDVIVLGVSRPNAIGGAIDRFLAELKGNGAGLGLPYLQVVEPAVALSEAARANLAKPPAPSFTAFRERAEQYLQTGEPAYADAAIAALEVMAGIYAKNPDRDVPWPEETTSAAIFAAWDAFEECPRIDPARRPVYRQAFLSLARSLIHHISGYSGIGDDELVAWNHTTFPLLGLYAAGRYFQRYDGLTETEEWLRKARQCFLAQAKSWKPQEDADGYLTLTMGHTIDYCLMEWDLEFFTSGRMKQYADYVVACNDNRLWSAGFGDSGVSANPSMVDRALPLAFWWTRDPTYRWVLEKAHEGSWPNPFWAVEPVPATRFVGVDSYPLDPQLYAYTATRPFYNETLIEPEVEPGAAFDKVAFRENWDVDGQYLLLDGFGRGKHLHYDTNAIIEFVQGGERWLLDHDYLTRNTTEHAMLSVIRNGRAEQLVPPLAALEHAGETDDAALVMTRVPGDNGIDWQRRVFWKKGRWFLVQDVATAREAGDYDLELTWKTIDRGSERIDANGRFTTDRAGAAETVALVVDDAEAERGQALVFGQQDSRLVFALDFPAGPVQAVARGYGVDGSSDSLWLRIGAFDPVSLHVPQGKFGPSGGNFDRSAPTPAIDLPTAGRYLVRVTLRERPPVRLDTITFRFADGTTRTIDAATAPPPQPGDAEAEVPRAFHIDPAEPVQAQLTRHVRQGITVPVAILHQRRRATLAAGESVTFASLLWATDPAHPGERRVARREDGAYRVTDCDETVIVGGPYRSEQGVIDAAGWFLDDHELTAFGLDEMRLAGVEASGEAADRTIELATGDAAAWDRWRRAPAAAVSPPQDAAPPAAATPVWSRQPVTEPVARVVPADLDGDGADEWLVAAGNAAVALSADGELLWTFPTGGVVRDVGLATFEAGRPVVLVSSADTHLYLLDPRTGEQRREQTMTGIYFSADHGERPWPLYRTLAVDGDGDGLDDLVVTTLGSMEMWGLDRELNKLWRYEFTYHGCTDLRAMDVTGDGTPEIVAADKYGSLHIARLDGSRVLRRYTSIGDVAFDILGQGENALVVIGSSTGDLIAVNLANEPRWQFDNFGYPVHAIRAAPGERPLILIASGTGYLYALDPAGKEQWRRPLGFAVTAIEVSGDTVVAGTADGTLHRLRLADGESLGAVTVGASVTTLGPAGTVAGLSDGRVMRVGWSK